MANAGIQEMADRVADLLERRFGLWGRGLEEKLRKGGRRLPRKLRLDSQILAQAAAMAQSPRLLVRIDHDQVAAAYEQCLARLSARNAAHGTMGRVYNFFASVILSLLVVVGLLLAAHYWPG